MIWSSFSGGVFSGVTANRQVSIPQPLRIRTVDGSFAEFEPLSISYLGQHHYVAKLFETVDAILDFDSMKSTDGVAAVKQVGDRPAKWWANCPLRQDGKDASVIIFSRVSRV